MAGDVSSTEQEPSIEEILASIRQIISDDDEPAPAVAPVASPEPEPQDDILELTNRADDSPDDVDLSFGESPAAEDDFIKVDMKEPEPEPEPMPEPEIIEDEPGPEYVPPPRQEPVRKPAMVDDDSLLTERAEAAALNAFTKLAAKTAIDTISGVTIEDIVRDEIRPMLRDWLDRNLPDMVERLVEEELDRVARRALGE
jgi:cell pole-organizing protein PopZ